MDFLRRADENGNGMIDPSELEGRMGGFIRRMAENNPRIDLSRPIPLDQLSAEFARMREERSRDGGGSFGGRPSFGGGPPGGGGERWGGPRGERWDGERGGERWGGRGSNADSGRSEPDYGPPGPRATKVAPLVPGFGVESVAVAPPGFGAEAQLFTVTITDEDRREAERAFRYYDRNQDGKIDADEMKNGRYGADLPMYDRNRDGVITLNEMEYRFARRRLENGQDNRQASAGPGGDRRESRQQNGPSDRDGDRADSNGKAAIKSYRRAPMVEQLPKGLPDWFARDDADGDGQVSMHEFSTSWTEALLSDYQQFDLNGDGLITPAECLAAIEKGAVRGNSVARATGSAAANASTDASASSSADAAASSGTDGASAAAADASPGLKIDPRYIEYFKKVFAKYDANGDGALTANEWASMSKDPTPADTDRNGRITLEEFARWQMQR